MFDFSQKSLTLQTKVFASGWYIIKGVNGIKLFKVSFKENVEVTSIEKYSSQQFIQFTVIVFIIV